MAGIYLHIPFCRQACHYCNFHFATSLRYKNEMQDALLKEIPLRSAYLQDETVETIYFGGGTPSLLDADAIQQLIDQLRETFTIAHHAEITLEANPDDITEEKIAAWKKAGVNRLSLGIQSFFEEDLQWMNRAHNAAQAVAAIELAIKHFDNITADLIYGTPQLTNEKWQYNVEKIISLGIPHISCYALTVEPKTPLEKLIRLQKSENVNPDKQSDQFLLLMTWLKNAGYEHYEISNFAKPGRRSRHNSSYWQGKKYAGIGPSAHSFNGKSRQWNIANNQAYINSIEKGLIPSEEELLSETEQLNEYIMTSLRTMEGLDISLLSSRFDTSPDTILQKAEKHINRQLLKKENDFLILTDNGKLFADGIAADFFF